MAEFSVKVEGEDAAFQAALPAAFEEWRVQAFQSIEPVADKVVNVAQVLVAKRTTKLEHTIVRGPLVIEGAVAWIEVRAGDGTRYAIYQEFGTYKMRAHPFMRPAFAQGAGILRAGGFSARVSSTSKTRAAVRRALHRQKLRRTVAAGFLTAAQARAESRRITGIRGFGVAPRRSRRR